MLRRKFTLTLACLTLAFSASVAHAQKAAELAAGLQYMVGTRYGALQVTSIKAVDQILVVQIDGPSGWRSGLTPKLISDALIEGFCSKSSGLFDDGVGMQIDSSEAGEDVWQGPLVTQCP